MKWQLSDNIHTYIYRYYLACKPIYEKDVSDRRAEELITFLKEKGFEAVMLYVDLYPYWYHMCDSLEHTQYYVEEIVQLAEKLRHNGISYQLNYQNLFGAYDGGADLRYINNWENYIDQEGRESWGSACNLGEKFRKIAGAKLRLWAETKPDVIWIDDDMRYHHHQTWLHDIYEGKKFDVAKEFIVRMDFGCFCDKHIEGFNKKHNFSYNKEEIFSGMKHGGELRKKWMAYLGECMEDTAKWIEEIVHSVSPDTRIAIMTSNPAVHSVEGRDWNTFLKGLSGNDRPMLRPNFPPYGSGASTTLPIINGYMLIEQLKTHIGAMYGLDVDFCPEIENAGFTVWSKSKTLTGLQLKMSAFIGCRCTTMSLHDLEGCIIEESPEFGEEVAALKPYVNRLMAETLWDKENEGVCLITSPDRIFEGKTHPDMPGPALMAYGRFWDSTLTPCGIPCKYVLPEQLSCCKVVALDYYTAQFLYDEEIMTLLSKGVIMDAKAAEYLIGRGFGEYLGVEVAQNMKCVGAVEVFNKKTRGDGSPLRIRMRVEPGNWNELILNGAEEETKFVTPDAKEYCGLVSYHNSLGGKIYTYALYNSKGATFYTSYRVEYLKEIINELCGGDIVRLNNSSYGFCAQKKYGDVYYVFVSNHCEDKFENPKLVFKSDVKEAEVICENGMGYQAIIRKNEVSFPDISLDILGSFVCKVKL